MENKRRRSSKKGLSKVNYKIMHKNDANSGNTNSKTKRKLKLRYKVPIIAVSVIVIVIIALILTVYFYAKSKLNNMQYSPIDKTEIEVNDDLHEEVDTGLTKKEFDSVLNIALFGSDSRDINDAEAGRSDSIMIASINPIHKSVKLISIPRDTYVSIKGYGKTKINHAYAYGAEQLSLRTINENFGLNIDKYITINFSGLINVINLIGGVELEISKAEMDVLNQYLKESYSITGKTYVPMTTYGKVLLNGEQALAHSRNRYVGSDFTRASRQRDVLEATMKKVSKMSKTKILSLADEILKLVKTNITSDEYMWLFTSLFPDMGSYVSNIISAQVPSTKYSSGQYISGVYYFVTDYDKAKSDFVEYLYKK